MGGVTLGRGPALGASGDSIHRGGSAMSRLRVCVIGCGAIAQIMHLPYLQELEQYEVLAICDISPKVLQVVGDKYNVARRYMSVEECVKAPGLDAALVLTHDHYPAVMAALNAGLHVFVEKPLCYTPKEAQEICDAARQYRRKVMVGYMKLFDPAVAGWRSAVTAVRSPLALRVHDYAHDNQLVIGDAYQIVSADDVPDDARERQAVEERLKAAVGATDREAIEAYKLMLGLGTHDLSLVRAVFGPPETIRYAIIHGGGRAVTWVSQHAAVDPVLWSIASTERKWFDQELTLYGASETLSIRFPSPYLKNAPTEVVHTLMDGQSIVRALRVFGYREAFRLELEAFYDAVVHDRPLLSDAEGGRIDVEVAAAVVREARHVH